MRGLLLVGLLGLVAVVMLGGECVLTGDSDCDGEVSLSEVIDFITLWAQDEVTLSDVIDAINNWAGGGSTTTSTTVAGTTTSTPSTTTTLDVCGNAVGNGYDIISGPSAPTDDDPDNPFRSLTVHPEDADVVLIGTERNGFVKSVDGGQSWTRLRNGLTHYGGGYAEAYDIAYSESNTSIIYAAMVGGPGPVTGSYPTSVAGVYKSVDGGNNWDRKNCGLNNSCVESIHVNPDNPDNVVIGVRGGETTFSLYDIELGDFYGGGIYRTVDGGGNWNRVNIVSGDNNNTYRRIIAAGGNSSLLYTFGYKMGYPSANVGFLKSTDGGATWSQFAPEMREYGVAYFDVSSNGSVIYVVSDVYKIFKSADGGETWSEYWIGSSGYGIDISPDDADRVLFSKFNSLYLSTDGLNSETQVINTTESISDVVFAPSNTSVAYAITIGYDVYRSVDSGASFSKVVNLRDDVLNVIP